jgi:hypothetical protein
MPNSYCAVADEFYVNMHLNTEMDLPSNRDTLLHYFEQLQKRFPTMRNFYNRDQSDYVLEEDKDGGTYSWASVEPRCIGSGHVNPKCLDTVFEHQQIVLQSVPHLLLVSPLDCESLTVSFCFEFNYAGNHHNLLAEAIGISPGFEGLTDSVGTSRLVSFAPSFRIALSDDCLTQARLHVESPTTAYHVRTGEFPDRPLSVYLTLSSYGSLNSDETYVTRFDELVSHGMAILDKHVLEHVLLPLQHAIGIK